MSREKNQLTFLEIALLDNNKIEGTPILKLALVKRFKIVTLFKNTKKVENVYFLNQFLYPKYQIPPV